MWVTAISAIRKSCQHWGGLLGVRAWRLVRRLGRAGAPVGEQPAAPAGRDAGATATEYALVLALVVVVLISTLTTLGTVLKEKIQAIIQAIQGAGT